MPRTGLSKDDITEVAVKLANENGLSYLSITTLAEALGIKKPSLYNHMNFGKKMGILRKHRSGE